MRFTQPLAQLVPPAHPPQQREQAGRPSGDIYPLEFCCSTAMRHLLRYDDNSGHPYTATTRGRRFAILYLRNRQAACGSTLPPPACYFFTAPAGWWWIEVQEHARFCGILPVAFGFCAPSASLWAHSREFDHSAGRVSRRVAGALVNSTYSLAPPLMRSLLFKKAPAGSEFSNAQNVDPSSFVFAVIHQLPPSQTLSCVRFDTSVP